MKKTGKNKKKKSHFWEIYAIYIAALAIIMAVLLIVGYNLMMDFDEAQGVLQRTADSVAAEIGGGNYDKLFKGLDETPITLPEPMIFETEAYRDKLDGLVEKGVVARKGFSVNRYDKPVYDILAGGEKVAELEYRKSEKESSFGFTTYELNKITPVIKGKYKVSVLLPEGAELSLNGVAVGSRWLVKDEQLKAEPVETNYLYEAENAYVSTLYVVEGLMANAEPKVVNSATGTEIEMVFDEAKKLWRSKTQEIEIVAPSNCELVVNGVTVSGVDRFLGGEASDIAEAEKSFAYVSENARVSMINYIIGGFKNTDVITVTAKAFNGAELPVVQNEKTGVYEVACLKLEDVPEELFGVDDEYVLEAAKTYGKAVNNDGSMSALLDEYVYKKSEAYTTLKDFWVVFSKHNSYWFEDEACSDVVVYNAELFSAKASFTYWIKGFDGKPNATKDYYVAVTFFFAKTEDGLKIVDFNLG